jgi:glyoxylase-like metal-dependent hydrolase (beta-lactamase superfamily II)
MSTESPEITITGKIQKQAWLDRVMPPVEMVRPGLWSIPTIFPDNPLRYVSSYAMSYDGGVALVDTGWPCEAAWDGLVAGLNEAGWDISEVKAVLVTHGHADHFGLARRIRERTGAWVGMHEADARLDRPAGSPTDFRAADEVWLRHRGGEPDDIFSIRSKPSDMFEQFSAAPDRFIADGERPLGPDRGLAAVWTPGHTPGHLCFHDTDHDLMLTGDHVLPRITPNISPGPTVTADTLGQYLQSLLLVAEIEVGEVLPAHEYRFAGLAARVHDLRHHHQIRLGEVMDVLHTSPGANSVDVTEKLAWSRPWTEMHGIIRRSAIGEAYAHLVHLEATGFIVNKGSDIDAWHAIRDGSPVLVDD